MKCLRAPLFTGVIIIIGLAVFLSPGPPALAHTGHADDILGGAKTEDPAPNEVDEKPEEKPDSMEMPMDEEGAGSTTESPEAADKAEPETEPKADSGTKEDPAHKDEGGKGTTDMKMDDHEPAVYEVNNPETEGFIAAAGLTLGALALFGVSLRFL